MSVNLRKLKKIVYSTLLLGSAFSLYACGSGSSNNDQGIAVVSTGYYDTTGDKVSGVSFAQVNLSSTSPILTNSQGKLLPISMGIQNRMFYRFVNITNIHCEYTVPGGKVEIPQDNFAVSGTISADTDGDINNPNDNSDRGEILAPDDNEKIVRTVYLAFPVISPEIFSFLNNHRNDLPETPFRLIASCVGEGIDQAGEYKVTNRAMFTVLLTDEAEVVASTTSTSLEGTTAASLEIDPANSEVTTTPEVTTSPEINAAEVASDNQDTSTQAGQ